MGSRTLKRVFCSNSNVDGMKVKPSSFTVAIPKRQNSIVSRNETNEKGKQVRPWKTTFEACRNQELQALSSHKSHPQHVEQRANEHNLTGTMDRAILPRSKYAKLLPCDLEVKDPSYVYHRPMILNTLF
ncbi:hypothetical protein TNCV_4427521 [Trichonephila clavipes]|nr:hypothetical protein TNCV_4427521 [Trichonephila clavipes]